MKIKLLSTIMINGKFAHPEDDKIHDLAKTVALDLISRKKAIPAILDIKSTINVQTPCLPQKTEQVNISETNPNPNLAALVNLAKEMKIKAEENISSEDLKKIIMDELKAMAEELKLEVPEGISPEDLYKKIEEELIDD